MTSFGGKRNTVWERERFNYISPYERDSERCYSLASKRPKYKANDRNLHLDIYTKIAVLKASPSIVGLVSYSRDEEIIQGSGTIIETNENWNIVLTSANLIRCPTHEEEFVDNKLLDNLKITVHTCNGKSYQGQVVAHDFNYNLAAIQFNSETTLVAATLAHLDDSISIVSAPQSFQIRAHSKSLKIVPGDKVIQLGRYFADSDIMAAHGEYCLERPEPEYDCRELFAANCLITRAGDGGPLVNYNGEVIGITYYDFGLMPWMPINIVCKWWEYYKRVGGYCQPSVGVEATNLYAAEACILERVMQNFPSICNGVLVEKVVPGSSADLAGIRAYDVIVQCCGRTVQSFLEFFETIWDKVGSLVELVVVRQGHVTPLHFSIHVDATSDRINRWPSRDYN